MNETLHRLHSAALGNERAIWIGRPEAEAPGAPLVIFLDADLYRDRVRALEVIEDLRARDAITDAWFVFVSPLDVETRYRECPCHPPFAQFVVTELLPWLERMEPGIATARSRTLVGLSYTGLAAAFVAKEFPGVFQNVICQSGSFWSQEAALAKEVRRAGRHLGAAFYLDVGLRETQPYVVHREGHVQTMTQIEGVHRFRDALLATGHTVKYAEFNGAHEASGWRQMLPEALGWALPPDAAPAAE